MIRWNLTDWYVWQLYEIFPGKKSFLFVREPKKKYPVHKRILGAAIVTIFKNDAQNSRIFATVPSAIKLSSFLRKQTDGELERWI